MKSIQLIAIILVLIVSIGCANEKTKKIKAYLRAEKERTLGELTVAFCDKLKVLKTGMSFEDTSKLGPILMGGECDKGSVSKRSFRTLTYTFDTECKLSKIELKLNCPN